MSKSTSQYVEYVRRYGFGLAALIALAFLTYSCWLMFSVVAQYINFTTTTGFLVLKQDWVGYSWWLFIFKVHVFSSGVVLLAGFSQFWSQHRFKRYRTIHRKLGYVYVCTIFALALPSGFVLALTALGGIIVKLSFLILCVLWGYTTFMAVVTARARQIARHRQFMVYSYALSFSAITLRFLKLGLYDLAPYIDWLTPMRIYRIESVLAWVINLCLAWGWLKFTQDKNN